MGQRNLFHSVLVLSSLHRIDRSISSFADQIHNFESSNELIFSFSCKFLKVSHLVKVGSDLAETLLACLLIQALQKRNVRLELLVVVAHIDECTEETGWEDDLEGLTILLNRV